jgi:hypothetical protein
MAATNNKIWEIHDMIRSLDRYIKHEKVDGAFSVTFYHNFDTKALIATRWSDQYYGADDNLTRVRQPVNGCLYTYSIKSNGIHFEAYAEWKPWTGPGYAYTYDKHWHVGADDNSMTLLQVPNKGPNPYPETMYLFHQKQIKDALSILPAWAIGVMA